MWQVDGEKETCGTQGDLHAWSEKIKHHRKVVLSVQESAKVIVAKCHKH